MKGMIEGYLHKDLQKSGPAMEKLDDKERQELEKVLKEESGKKR